MPPRPWFVVLGIGSLSLRSFDFRPNRTWFLHDDISRSDSIAAIKPCESRQAQAVTQINMVTNWAEKGSKITAAESERADFGDTAYLELSRIYRRHFPPSASWSEGRIRIGPGKTPRQMTQRLAISARFCG
jgi:hypothetical protein